MYQPTWFPLLLLLLLLVLVLRLLQAHRLLEPIKAKLSNAP
jgi:hypothetical protein